MFFSNNLKCLRNEKELSQEMLGSYIGVSKQEIYFLETKRREPSIENIINISEYFDVTIDDLLKKDMYPIGSTLGKNLKFLRNGIGALGTEIGAIFGVNGSTYSKYENGLVEPKIEGLIAVSKFFGVTVDDLLKKDLSKGGNEI